MFAIIVYWPAGQWCRWSPPSAPPTLGLTGAAINQHTSVTLIVQRRLGRATLHRFSSFSGKQRRVAGEHPSQSWKGFLSFIHCKARKWLQCSPRLSKNLLRTAFCLKGNFTSDRHFIVYGHSHKPTTWIFGFERKSLPVYNIFFLKPQVKDDTGPAVHDHSTVA